MKNIKHIRRRSIGTFILLLILLCFIFTPALLFGNFDFGSGYEKTTDEEGEYDINLSTNYLFKGTTYTFNLDDFYDDTNLYKIYTGAKFQTEMFNGTTLEWTGVVNNDTVTPVDNDEIQYGESSGVYNGTYDFREFADGTEGYDITDFVDYYSADTDCYAKIISEIDGHKKVLEISDDNNAGIVSLDHYYDEIQTDSTIEFWWRYDGTLSYQHYLYMRFREGITERVRLLFGYQQIGQIVSHNGTDYISIVTGLPVNTFYHIKIVFDDSANTFDFYINEEDKGVFDYVSNSVVGISRIDMDTRDTGDNYHHWLDAIGCLWDTDYTIGENLYPDNINMLNGSYDYTDNMKVNDDTSTNFTSTHTDGYFYETPHQWDDFTFTEGTGEVIGEIETIDADYSEIDCFFEASDTYGIMRPVGDIATGSWSKDGFTYFYENVDDDVEEPDAGDGNTIYTSTDGDSIYFDLTNIGYIIKSYVLWVRHRCSAGTEAVDLYMDYNDGGGYGYIGQEKTSPSYEWDYVSVSSINKLGNGWNLRIRAASPSPYTHFIDVVYLKVLYEGIDSSLDVQVDMQVDNPNCSSIEYLKYSHKTNVSVTMDLDIWNWDTSTWYEIESVDNSATFDDDSFTLGIDSDYVNSSFGVRIRFQATSPSSDFALLIDRLRLDYLTTPAELEMTISFTFARYNEDLLAMTIQSWQKTNISQTITFKIWNYDTESYVQISSSSDTTFTKKEYNTESPSNFISPTGTVKLNWVGSDIINDFELHIDYLFIQIFYKLDLVHSKSFDTNGIYRYRWEITGSIHYTDWVIFEVIDPIPNFHAISESDSSTRWILQGAELSPFENFTDNIDPSSDWDLYDVSPVDFNKYVPDLTNYLLDNYVYYGSSYISPAQWADFTFTKGAGDTVGELETDNDANYAIVNSELYWYDESLLGYIVPDGDILTNWNEGDAPPHWSLLYEAKGDMNGDGGNIRETTHNTHDKWNFNSLTVDAGRVITKLVIAFYTKIEIYEQSTLLSYVTSTGQSGTAVGGTTYSWVTTTHTGLSLSQADLNSFWIDVYPYFYGGTPRYVDIETVYVDVYTCLEQYSVDYEITWDVDEPESMDNFSYDYRTTFAIDCDLDIYNWDTTNWLELESNTGVGWYSGSYALTDPYISGSDEIKIRFQSALTATNFDMELDQIALVYNSIYTISKKHNDTIPGYIYMQTNTSELISLNSSVYGTNYTLSSGDYFTIEFQTSSDSQINLILLKNGVINKTLIISSAGNTNFNRHTIQISVDEDAEFDQLRFSSTLEDTDYFRCYDIKTYKYMITGDYKDFRVGSKNDYEIYLTPDTYNLRICDPYNTPWKLNTTITISSGYNYYIYEPTETIQCRLTLFTLEKEKYLQFENYHVIINRSLNDAYFRYDLLYNIFCVDFGTDIHIEVYDRFDNPIKNTTESAKAYIDLEIEVYSLQIKNLQTQKTTIDINITLYSGILLSEESLYFMLAKDYYQIGYYDTNDVYKHFLIYLNSNQAYELNRSKICFLAFVNQKGEHLYFNDYKTYINNSLIYENVFYREIGDDIGIEVKDIYGISIKNQTYTVVSGDNYIPVVLTMYSLKVMNQQEKFNHINITRDPNYYESGYYWSEWIAPNEIIKFRLFAGYYKINLTDNEGGSYSYYSYTLSGDDFLLISSDNVLSQVIYNIANVNTTIGNQITNVEINITNQNSEINNTIVNIEINLSNVNSTLGNLLTNIDVNILNLESDINSLYLFTNTSIWNLNNAMNTSFIYMENNIYSINQSISTLVIGIDNSISLVNATITSMFTEMNNQFIVVQSTLNYSFAFLNQSIIQLANDITENHVILYNLIEQRANEIDSSLIDVQTLINLVNNTVADESLVIQTLVNLIGTNITNNHIIINNLLNLIDNNITNNNIQLVSILEVIGNNITTNHFVIQTLIDVIGNNITYNHIELLTNLNLINTTISQNQIELINRLLFINNTINDMMFELTNQLLFLNGTIYNAVLNLSTSIEFGVDMVLGNITITYQQNEFLTELYKETMFSQLLNWSGVAYNYTLMEDRIDVWTFVNHYVNQSVEIHLRYQDLIEKLAISADDFRDQWLPNKDVEYNLWSVVDGKYEDEWKELDPKNKTVNFGFYEEKVPDFPSFENTNITIVLIILIFIGVIGLSTYFVYKYNKRVQNLKVAYARQHTIEKDLIDGVAGRSSRMKRI